MQKKPWGSWRTGRWTWASKMTLTQNRVVLRAALGKTLPEAGGRWHITAARLCTQIWVPSKCHEHTGESSSVSLHHPTTPRMIFEIEWDAVLDPVLSLQWIQYLQGQCCARSITRVSLTFAKQYYLALEPTFPASIHAPGHYPGLCQHIPMCCCSCPQQDGPGEYYAFRWASPAASRCAGAFDSISSQHSHGWCCVLCRADPGPILAGISWAAALSVHVGVPGQFGKGERPSKLK